MTPLLYQQLIELNPAPTLILLCKDNEFLITNINNAFLESSNSSAEELLFKSIFCLPLYAHTKNFLACKTQLLFSMKAALGAGARHQTYLEICNEKASKYYQITNQLANVCKTDNVLSLIHFAIEINEDTYMAGKATQLACQEFTGSNERNTEQLDKPAVILSDVTPTGVIPSNTALETENIEPFIKLDIFGNIAVCNAAAKKMFGFGRSGRRAEGARFADFLDAGTKEMFETKCRQAVNKKHIYSFNCFDTKKSVWLHVFVCPLYREISVCIRHSKTQPSAAQELVEDRHFLRILIDSLPDTIYFKDRKGRKLISNREDYELLGADSEKEVLGKTDYEVLPIQSAKISYAHDLEVINQGRPLLNLEERFVTPAGKEKWLLTSKIPLFDDNKMVIGLLGIGRDITIKKHIQLKNEAITKALLESEKKYFELFDLSPQPMWLYDKSTLRFLSVNQKAIHLYGYSKTEFLEMTIKDIRPEEDRPIVDEWVKNDFCDPGRTIRHCKKNGEFLYVNISADDINFNGREAKLIAVNDITRLTEYVSVINSQNERLREIARIQSHEVRAPLARILGLVQLLKSSDTTNMEKEELMDYLSFASCELDNVIRQVCDTSYEEREAYARLHNGKQENFHL